VLGQNRRAHPLGKQPLGDVRLEISVRAGLLEKQMLLVAQALAGRAIEDPALLPFIEMLEPFEQEDGARGNTHQQRPRIVEPREREEAIFSARMGIATANTMIATLEAL